jgi:hypothetical protein
MEAVFQAGKFSVSPDRFRKFESSAWGMCEWVYLLFGHTQLVVLQLQLSSVPLERVF